MSSLLGVAGGELIIPSMIFLFGLDVRAAGTASLLISIPTVIVGVFRHWRLGAYKSRKNLTSLVFPMAVGSVLGAITGAILLPYISSDELKIGLAAILAASSVKLVNKSKAQ